MKIRTMKGFTQRMIVLGALLLGLGSVLAYHSHEPSIRDEGVADKSVAGGSLTDVMPDTAADAAVGLSSPLVQGLTLPYAGSVSSSVPGFFITQTGPGSAGTFRITNTSSAFPALQVVTNGTNGGAILLASQNASNGAPALIVNTDGTGFAGRFSGTGSSRKGVYISAAAGQPGLQVAGGTKSAVVATHQGARALYTEEATEVWFADYGFGRLHNGRTTIQIDPLFAETVNLDEPYHVFVQAYGDAELYVSQRTPTAFEVRLREGDLNVEFSYRLVAKRWGFEQKRLEPAPWADDDSSISQEKLAKQKAKHQPTVAELKR
jgi:hypothetical protein